MAAPFRKSMLFVLIPVLLGLASPAHATVPIRLDVTYSSCGIVEGPLSLGLDELPESIHATFVFLPPSWPPPTDVPFDPQVLFASLELGELYMKATNIQYFTVAFSYTVKHELTLSMLTYLGQVAETDCCWGLDMPNSSFEINITGTVKTTDEFFHYHCTTSSQTFAEITALEVPIDVKPSSCPNALDPASRGLLPVALLPAGVFDPESVDPTSLTLRRADGTGSFVKALDGPPGPRVAVEDVAAPSPGDPCDCHELAGDGLDDVSMKFKTPAVSDSLELAGLPAGEEVELVLRGFLEDGTLLEGSDCVTIVPRGPGENSRSESASALAPEERTISRLRVHPNPGLARTIAFDLARGGIARIEVFDVAGRALSVPFEGDLAAGSHEISWDGRSRDETLLKAGVYFVRVSSRGYARSVRLVQGAAAR